MTSSRAALLAIAMSAAALTGGCGFHAVYASGNPARVDLSSVYVNLLPNRPGQLLRQSLQARLDATDDAAAKRYTLAVQYTEHVQNVNVQFDNSVTRQRDFGEATWTLYALDSPTQKLASGTVRSVDGYNIVDEQFFYQTMETESAEHRLADALADQIVLGISGYFNKHPDKDVAAK